MWARVWDSRWTWRWTWRWIMRGICPCICLGTAALCLAGARAQEPRLQQRKGESQAAPAQDETKTAAEVISPLTLPTDAGGEYVFGKPGEFIEIIFQDGLLHGYMSRESGAENDRGVPLTYHFSRTSVDGARIGFTTYVIHGASYSFAGTIVQGGAKSLAEDGFYRLVGSLVLHDEATHTQQRRSVNLKLSRRM